MFKFLIYIKMKHLKLFEKTWNITYPNVKPKVGDYVFVKPNAYKNKLCQIINITNDNIYNVEFSNFNNNLSFTRDELIPFETEYKMNLYLQTIKYNL